MNCIIKFNHVEEFDIYLRMHRKSVNNSTCIIPVSYSITFASDPSGWFFVV